MEHAFFCHISEGDFKNALSLLEFALIHRISSFKRSIIMTLLYDLIWFQRDREIVFESMFILSSSYLLEQYMLLEDCLKESESESDMISLSFESLYSYNQSDEFNHNDYMKDRRLLHRGNVIRNLFVLESFFEPSWTGKRYETRSAYDIIDKNEKLEFIMKFYMNIILISGSRWINSKNSTEDLLHILCHPIQHDYASDSLVSCLSGWINEMYRLSFHREIIESHFSTTLLSPLFYHHLDTDLCSIIKDSLSSYDKHKKLSMLLEYLVSRNSVSMKIDNLNALFKNS